MEPPLFFSGWDTLLRTLVVGVLAYLALVVLLRMSGNRTLSKMNAFDLIVTVALGSTLATVLLDRNIALAEGVLAFALLIGLQYIVTWSSVRAGWVRRVVTGEPSLLFYRGQTLPGTLQRVRITEAELLAAIRAAGVQDIGRVEAVVLETDGSLSVVRRDDEAACSSLARLELPASEISRAE